MFTTGSLQRFVYEHELPVGKRAVIFRSREFRQHATLQLFQGGRVLDQEQVRRLAANTSLTLSGEWVEKVDYSAEPVKLVIQT